MPEPTSMGGGFSCQVCGSTYESEQLLIQHGREQHPGKPVTWGDPIESTTHPTSTTARTETTVYEEEKEETTGLKEKMESMGDKIKAGTKAAGSKMKDPDRDLETEYQQKKAEQETK
jgi:hypothetical protein